MHRMAKYRVRGGYCALVAMAALAVFCLCSCASDESLIHIQGSSATITKPMLDHWMKAIAALDYLTYLHTPAPEGLVSEPADYERCAKAARRVIPRTSTGKLKLSDAQIARRCRGLHQAIKSEALALLLAVQWMEIEAKEQGITVSKRELRKELQNYSQAAYGAKANWPRALRERHITTADTMYLAKRLVLYKQLREKFRAKVAKAGGGEGAFARIATANYQHMIKRTTCARGYVIQGCKGYREPGSSAPPAWVILEGLAKGGG